MDRSSVYEVFRDVGRDLFVSGSVSSHGGNLSVVSGDRILITRRGAMLGRLAADDIVDTALSEPDERAEEASRELLVHRAIYEKTDAAAVCHAHPVHAIVRSLVCDEVVPIDSEGRFLLPRVPVFTFAMSIGSPDVAATVSAALREHRCVLVRGHGAFAAGSTLDEAYQWVSVLEVSCRILDLHEGLRLSPTD